MKNSFKIVKDEALLTQINGGYQQLGSPAVDALAAMLDKQGLSKLSTVLVSAYRVFPTVVDSIATTIGKILGLDRRVEN